MAQKGEALIMQSHDISLVGHLDLTQSPTFHDLLGYADFTEKSKVFPISVLWHFCHQESFFNFQNMLQILNW